MLIQSFCLAYIVGLADINAMPTVARMCFKMFLESTIDNDVGVFF